MYFILKNAALDQVAASVSKPHSNKFKDAQTDAANLNLLFCLVQAQSREVTLRRIESN